MKQLKIWLALMLLTAPLAVASETTLPAAPAAETAKDTAATTAPAPAPAEAAAATETTAKGTTELSEGLIYSVDRVPERTFDTARAVEVITATDLWRKSGLNVADALQHEAGISVINYNSGGGIPVTRGLHGKQVMVMIDGVKVNDAMWRSTGKDYLGTLTLAEIERIEVVRGVVSVLGTESLGGVINIITKKGPPAGESFGGSVGGRYMSGAQAYETPVEAYGRTENLRWIVGGSYLNGGDNHGGGDIGRQPNTGFVAQNAFGTMQYLWSAEKTVTASYRSGVTNDIQRAWRLAEGTDLWFKDTPSKLKLASVSYQDLTDRSFEDSFRATAYYNRQSDARDEITKADPNIDNRETEVDNLGGLSLEFGTFLGASHHLLYGLDASSEKIRSHAFERDLKTNTATSIRGRYTDGAQYRTAGVYLQDRFSLGHLVTATVGARYGTFQSSGAENSSIGKISIDARNSDFTGAVNLVFHPTASLNLIANAMRGFRAPNIDELSRVSVRTSGTDVPNPDAGPEHVNSYELGAKYEGARFSTSLFVYNNSFTDLLTRQQGLFNGLPFLDKNGNGKQDAKEPPIRQLKNVGTGTMRGVEAEFRYSVRSWMSVNGNITRTIGNDTFSDEPLESVPPTFGSLAAGFFGSSAHRPWAELIFDFASAQHRLNANDISNYRIGPNGTDAYNVFSIRGGATLMDRFRVTVGVDNLTNEAYKTHDSFIYRPGRQLVLGTEYRF